MLKLYFKQAWALLRQNPLFSVLYIVGTGLAIAMTTVVAVIYYTKLAPVYPEPYRDRTAVLHYLVCKSPDGKSMWTNAYSLRAVEEWAGHPKHARLTTATLNDMMAETCYIQPADRSGDFHPAVKLTDPAFFRVYPLEFLEGQPFTQADLDGGLHKAVITHDLARRLYGTDRDVVGRTFSLDYEQYTVCGVVRSGSYLMSDSYAQVYLPYSVVPGYDQPSTPVFPYLGSFTVTYVLADGSSVADLRAELEGVVSRLNQEHKDAFVLDMHGFPIPHWAKAVGQFQGDYSLWSFLRFFLLLAAVLLLVPALNLSGMISSRMEGRLAEMGVRKSFGANRRQLLGQVMWENLLLTLLGGLLGLVTAWAVVYAGRSWVFRLMEDYGGAVPEGVYNHVPGEVVFAPAVFLFALLLCLLLNLLSALVPAWMSLRKPIVRSLYERR